MAYYLKCLAALLRHRQPMPNCTWRKTFVAILRRECRPHWLRAA